MSRRCLAYALLLTALLCPFARASSGTFKASVRVEAETRDRVIREVTFPSPRPGLFPADNTVWGHLHIPKDAGGKGPPPCVLVLPIMAAPNSWIEQRFVNAFVSRGMAAMWLEMPFQFHRRPDPLIPSGQVFLARNPRRLAGNFRQSVADARRALEWLGRSGLVDKDRLGLFGVSLGGMVAASVYSQDASPKGAVLLLAGADFPSLLKNSSMTKGFVERLGVKPESFAGEWKDMDPLTYREANNGKHVLLINARSDTVMPKQNALALKEAFPDSRQLWVPFGHYTGLIHVLWVRGYAAREFGRIFASAAAQ